MRHILLTIVVALVSVASNSAERLLALENTDDITVTDWLKDMMHLQEMNYPDNY